MNNIVRIIIRGSEDNTIFDIEASEQERLFLQKIVDTCNDTIAKTPDSSYMPFIIIAN